jgi:hypothetical protein
MFTVEDEAVLMFIVPLVVVGPVRVMAAPRIAVVVSVVPPMVTSPPPELIDTPLADLTVIVLGIAALMLTLPPSAIFPIVVVPDPVVAIEAPANVGLLVVAMFCGVESVIWPTPLVTVIWLAVPVSEAATGSPPVDPMIN